MPISEICSRGVVIVSPDDSLHTVAELMRQHHVGSVVVTRDQDGLCRPVGIITDRDIVLALIAKDVPPEAVSAGDLMSQPRPAPPAGGR
jgi:CBS domain-containing protein